MITCPHCGSTKVEKNGNCATFNREQRKPQSKPIKKSSISRDPKKWSNTFLCSDGTRVTQAEIAERRLKAYNEKYNPFVIYPCEACGIGRPHSHAHIIPQARCKAIGKTELIWHPDNFFRAHNLCNTILENPKNPEWKNFKNIDKCLAFIKLHDPELYAKFELSAVKQETEPHIL